MFDGGAKTSNGLLLNDKLHVGHTVQQDLYSVVVQFRTHQVCFTADMARMYRQDCCTSTWQGSTVTHQYLTCYKFKAQVTQQLMGELPSRIQPSRPFLTTGVDCAGPTSFRLGTTCRKTTKSYNAVFFCFVTKAVHIEVVTSLTSEAFLAALRRFIALSEKPKTRSTNFQGTSNQLHEVYIMLQSSSQMARVQDFLATEGCDWKFIPLNGHHFRGLCKQL